MFIAELFIIAKMKQPKCPGTDEWIKIYMYMSIIHCMFPFIYRILKKKPKTYKYISTNAELHRYREQK